MYKVTWIMKQTVSLSGTQQKGRTHKFILYLASNQSNQHLNRAPKEKAKVIFCASIQFLFSWPKAGEVSFNQQEGMEESSSTPTDWRLCLVHCRGALLVPQQKPAMPQPTESLSGLGSGKSLPEITAKFHSRLQLLQAYWYDQSPKEP